MAVYSCSKAEAQRTEQRVPRYADVSRARTWVLEAGGSCRVTEARVWLRTVAGVWSDSALSTVLCALIVDQPVPRADPGELDCVPPVPQGYPSLAL